MGPIETFKLDMADDFDIDFSKASKVFTIMVSLAIEQAPGRIARQKMVNAFARAIRDDREEVIANFEMILNDIPKAEQTLKNYAGDRAVRSANNSMRKMDKMIRDLYKFGGA